MKRFLIGAMCTLTVACTSFGQGEVFFANSANSLTHIYTNGLINGWGTINLFGGQISGAGAYMFALFSAPSTVNDVYYLPWEDARWQFTGNYATNWSVGRIRAAAPLANGAVAIPGYLAGETASLVVIGWSTALGGTNLTSLIDAWNGGIYADYGLSGVAHIPLGNDALIPDEPLFGFNTGQIGGFVLGVIPEPSVFALAGLGGTMLLFHRRRRGATD